MSWSELRRSPGAPTILWALFAGALAGSAFRIDEPTFLAMARQMAANPLDPYGFLFNWDYSPEPAFAILSNPPLVPAWLAAVGRLFGWSEWAMHLAMLPFGALVIVALVSLARDSGVDSSRAAWLIIASPAFLVASTTVMPDVAMLALGSSAVAAAVRWDRTGARRWLVMASIAASLAPLAKYNGIVVVAPLFVLAFAYRRKSLLPFLVASLPIVGLQLWNAATIAAYGESHFSASARFQGEWRFQINGVLVAFGGAVLPLAVAICRPALRAILFYILGIIAAFAGALVVYEYPPGSAAVFAVALTLACGYLIRLVLAADLADSLRDPATLALFAWIAATLALQFRLLFTAPRYLLPLLPAVILLALIHERNAGTSGLWGRGTLGAGLLLAGAVALVDAGQAGAYRQAIEEYARPRAVASGHWGFQYYAERAGASQIDARNPRALQPGDRVLIARAPFPRVRGVAGDVSYRSIALQSRFPLVTYSCAEYANFHGSGVGSCDTGLRTAVPFAFSTKPFDRIDVYDVGTGGARFVTSE